MELKKYFHSKILTNLISVLIGVIIVSIFITTQTLEPLVISTYGYLFVIFAFGYQVIKASVQKVKNEKHKINKEWWFIVASSFLAIAMSMIAYYGLTLFYRVVAGFLTVGFLSLAYCLYRFMYLPKIFLLPKVRQEVLYFSWKLWGEMLDKGEEEAKIADMLVHAQTITNRRFDSNAWGARFSKLKVYNEPTGEDSTSGDNVDIPVATLSEMKELALRIVRSYEKKN